MNLRIRTTASALLFFTAVLLIFPFAGSLIVLGAGYALNRIAGIGFVPGAAIFIATLATGVLTTGIAFLTREIRAVRTHLFLENDESWDEEENDGDDDDHEEGLERDEDEDRDWAQRNLNLNPAFQSAPKVGRNHPCPCGSKKKYKMCCLRQQETVPDDIPF